MQSASEFQKRFAFVLQIFYNPAALFNAYALSVRSQGTRYRHGLCLFFGISCLVEK
jgi:hypothetical protein